MKIILSLLLLALSIAQLDASRSATSDQAPIVECPGRSVPQLRAGASESEISLLFYYVSWASEARQARLVYNGLAHYYQEYGFFGAIDCWHLQCNCSRTLMPAPGVAGAGGYPDKWPTLIVRYGQKQLLQYQGSWSFEDLARFMNNLLQPLDRAHSSQDLAAIRKHSDAVVLGLLDSPDDKAYNLYLAAGLRWLELDPERNIRFTVYFGNSARKMLKSSEAKLPQFVVIDSRNGVHTFNGTSGVWKTIDILRWVRSTLKNMSLFSNGYGTPMTIAMKARHVPVLAMGVRMNQYHHASVMGEEMAYAQKKQSEGCEDYWKKFDKQSEDISSSLNQVPKELFGDGEQTRTCYPAWSKNKTTLKNYYRINRYLNHLWRQYSHQNHPSYRNVPHLLRLHSRNLCLAHSQHGTPAIKIGIAKMVTKYGQLIWQHSTERAAHNRSLGVVIFDSVKYRDYLHQLGIQQTHQQLQVFILDAAEESLYVMPQQHTFSYVALKDFIRQFYARTLPRTHKNALAMMESGFSRKYNRQMLLQAIQRPNVTNVVFMHRPDCALSAVLSQAFLQVSALLGSPEVHFVRFDSQANDLPWELAMPTTPSLIVFPQAKSAESVVFPTDVRIDVQNVFAFVIAQLEPEQQVRSVLTSCRRRMRNVRSCLDFARNLVLQHVNQYLKFWDIYERERDDILSHLREFNNLHMSIESSIRL